MYKRQEQVEAELTSALGDFVMARAVMSPEVLEEAVMYLSLIHI